MSTALARLDRTVRRSVLAGLVALAVAAALSGCTGAEVTNPGGQVDADDVKTAILTQVNADAKNLGQRFVGYEMEHGTFTGFDTSMVRLSAMDRVVDVQHGPGGGVDACVIDPTTGAWALWQSSTKTVTGSGASQSETACTPGG